MAQQRQRAGAGLAESAGSEICGPRGIRIGGDNDPEDSTVQRLGVKSFIPKSAAFGFDS